jgi:hypothetical protein
MKTYNLIFFPLAIILCILCNYLGEQAEIFNKIGLGIFILICGFSLYLTVYGFINWIKSFKKS